MVQRVALHTIKRMTKQGKRATDKEKAVRPEYETIKAGTLLELSGDELRDLEKAGAVVDPKDKRAARFGYGTEIGQQVVAQEEGETEESATRRRRAARTTAATTEATATNGRRRGGRRAKSDADLVG